jgi:hypothetical protein
MIRPYLPGIAFAVEEHAAIARWMDKRPRDWPSIELALNYPGTPEMLGIVEGGWTGPTYFMWRVNQGVVLERFSGGDMVLYQNISDALDALSRWSESIIAGKRELLAGGRRLEN